MDENKNLEVVTNGVPYSNIKNLIKVFSSSEYDSLEKAASEIIDNAVDANAEYIIVFFHEEYNEKKGKKVLSEIAFLDNGEAMTPGILQHIVGFGSTNKTLSKKIGKFGIGLNQASLFACKKFSVYSWLKENEVYLEDFDSEYIEKNNIESAAPPVKTNLPKYIKNNSIFDQYFKNRGTLIVWSKFKEIKIAKAITLAKRFKNEFGRIYRNFLYNDKVKIFTFVDQIERVKAIDPMFLLDNTEVLGDIDGHSTKVTDGKGETLFEPFSIDGFINGSKTFSIPYEKEEGIIETSEVILRAAIIKEKFYYNAAYKDNIKQPGDTEIGKYVSEFQKGITVVRNNREIDFNYFGFYDSNNQPQDRWFKIEIDFNEELDNVFHVSNNKQHVEIKKVNDSKIQEYKEDEPNYPIWLRLKKDIDKLLSAMRNRNRALASGAKNKLKSDDHINEENKENNQLDKFINDFSNKDLNEEMKKQKEESIYEKEENSISKEKSINIEKTKSIEKNNKYYEENNFAVNIEGNLSDWVTYGFDYNTKKYMITFDEKKINKENFDCKVEFLVVIICVSLCNEIKGSDTYKELIRILDLYKNFICN